MYLEYCLTTAPETFAWAKNRGVKHLSVAELPITEAETG